VQLLQQSVYDTAVYYNCLLWGNVCKPTSLMLRWVASKKYLCERIVNSCRACNLSLANWAKSGTTVQVYQCVGLDVFLAIDWRTIDVYCRVNSSV